MSRSFLPTDLQVSRHFFKHFFACICNLYFQACFWSILIFHEFPFFHLSFVRSKGKPFFLVLQVRLHRGQNFTDHFTWEKAIFQKYNKRFPIVCCSTPSHNQFFRFFSWILRLKLYDSDLVVEVKVDLSSTDSAKTLHFQIWRTTLKKF